MMKLGCAYFGNRILKHARTDLEEMRSFGCNYVVHTFSENDMMFCKAAVVDIVKLSKDMGFEVWIDPWGVGRVFGGEAFSNFAAQNFDVMQQISDGNPTGAACPNNPKFRQYMKDWCDAAAESEADVYFWDEPHFYLPGWLGGRPNTWGCRCKHCQALFQERTGHELPTEETEEVRAFKEQCIFEFLAFVVSEGTARNRKNALCVLPARGAEHSTANWDRMGAIPGLDVFGTDPYWISFKRDMHEFVSESTRDIVQISERLGLEAQLWLQGFKIPAGQEQDLVTATELMAELGCRNIAVWGFDACRHLSWIRPANPDLCWDKIKEGFRNVAEKYS